MINEIIRSSKKFYCLEGFVAIIFSILAIRAVYIFFCYASFWNGLSAILMGIFAYWWVRRILNKCGSYSNGRGRWSSTKRGNTKNCSSNNSGNSYRKIDLN
jgi:hypothetical protein